MNTSSVVSLHPYFRVRPGKLAAVKALLPALVEKTVAEPKNLFYDFTLNDDELFCREAYAGADGAQTHVTNVGPLLADLLKLADLTRLEIHGPVEELEKLKGPMAHLKPVWFVYQCGRDR